MVLTLISEPLRALSSVVLDIPANSEICNLPNLLSDTSLFNKLKFIHLQILLYNKLCFIQK
nr:MAG TPA: hypothetical protein [Caudoviricetes sp.]